MIAMSGIHDKVEEFVSLRGRLDSVNAEKKELEGDIDQLKDELIAYMEANPVGSLISSRGFRLFRGTRRFAEITDYRSLENWAGAIGDDFVRRAYETLMATYAMKGIKPEIFINQPKKRLLNTLLKYYADEAERLSVPMDSLLPPGLEQKTTDFISMRKPTKKQSAEFKDAAQNIVEMAKKGALINDG